MNKRTPYEQQLADELNHLQLPDEDKAWAAMQRMLDKDDNDRPPVAAAIPRKGCAGWAALLILLLVAGGATYYFLGQNEDKEKIVRSLPGKTGGKDAIPSSNNPGSSISGSSAVSDFPDSSNPARQPAGNIPGHNVPGNTDNEVSGVDGREIKSTPGMSLPGNETAKAGKVNREIPVKNDDNVSTKPGKRRGTRAKSNTRITASQAINENGETVVQENQPTENEIVKKEQELPVETMDIIMEPVTKENDSSIVDRGTDTSKKDTIGIVQNVKQDTVRRKKITFAAGLAIQHNLAFNGTETGLMGKKPYRRDYLPSVYLRLNRGKWFLQGEFKYGAPQNLNGFTYRTINQDTVQGVSFATSYALRRTYYHQLPISLHYTVKPGWSIGAGVVYNHFNGTISEKSLRLSVAGTPVDTILEKNLVDAKYDSAFARNTWQWMAESQYKWKRFSFGARYASGLQPFIRYRDPNGIQRSKRQQSLNLFVRYELWRSKR